MPGGSRGIPFEARSAATLPGGKCLKGFVRSVGHVYCAAIFLGRYFNVGRKVESIISVLFREILTQFAVLHLVGLVLPF